MKRLVLFLLCGLVAVPSSEAANIYFVSFHSADNTPSANATAAGFTQAPDVGYTQLLTANGHTVTRVVSSGTPNVALLNAADLVIISRSVPSGDYQDDPETLAWNGITAPTIILGGYILRGSRLGYTTGDTIPDVNTAQVRLRANIPGHPVFAGVPLDGSGVMVNAYASIQSYTNTLQRGISVNTSPIAGDGVVIGSIGSAGDAAVGGMVIAEWTPGASLATSPVNVLGGHRMILLTGSRENAAFSTNAALTAEAAGIYDLTGDGARLLLNAVNYMARSAGRRIVTVNTVNNETPGAAETSLNQALTGAQDGDYVRFAIPGAGPHIIVTPIGGYPLITANNLTIDGYNQPGAAPNSNPILDGNNARIDIVLDSRTGPEQRTPLGPLNNPGYGDGESTMLGVLGGKNFAIRGISFLSRQTTGQDETPPFDPYIYCLAFINDATGAQVQGCWFGIAPDGTTVSGGRASIASFKGEGGAASSEMVIGTDGDGVSDRAEFNLHMGMSLAIHLETPRVRLSGNYINVYPDGRHFFDIEGLHQQLIALGAGDDTVEAIENGDGNGMLIGTDGNGIGDGDERNIFGHTVYSRTIEFWGARPADGVIIAGNYFGVGGDGTSEAPVPVSAAPDFVQIKNSSAIRIGSNGDGISDDIEGNLIYNTPGDRFVDATGGQTGANITKVLSRRNRFKGCGFQAVPFADSVIAYAGYYSEVVADSSLAVPVLSRLANGVLSGSFAAPNSANYPFQVVDLYTVDPSALGKTNYWPAPMVHPLTFLGSYTDNGPGDSNPNANEFSIDVSSFGLSDTTYVAAAVSYSAIPGLFNATNAVTSPMSNPISALPTLSISLEVLANATLSWLAPDGLFRLEFSNDMNDPGSWFPLGTGTYTGGRNTVLNAHDPFSPAVFFRLISVP